MPLVPLHEMYEDANDKWYAIGQFNVSNLEFVQAVVESAEEMKSPAIIAASSSAFIMVRLGFEDVAVYMGSLQEWAADEANPMVVDEP